MWVMSGTDTHPHRLSLANIARASDTVDPVFTNTPQFECHSLSSELGCRLVVKVETLNPIGSFKARGAYFMVSQLPGRPHLVCATAGNFGQGVAHAARSRGLLLTVFVPARTDPDKIERIRAFGATVHCITENYSAAQQAAVRFAAASGAVLLEDGRQEAIAEGAGTIGVELLRWPQPLDVVVVPLGDGALLGGIARWVKAHSAKTRMVGICATGSPAMRLSWRARRPVSTAPPQTIAQGLAVQSPHAEAVADLVDLVDDILLVDDEALIAAVRLAHRELGLVLEPSGAAGIAGIVAHAEQFRGAWAATVLTGGGSLPA
jgi:threonine dehydratase